MEQSYPLTMSSLASTVDLWPWYKEILATVEAAVLQKNPGSRAKLEIVLKDAKNDLKNLLQNPSPNSADANSLRKAVTDGIILSSRIRYWKVLIAYLK